MADLSQMSLEEFVNNWDSESDEDLDADESDVKDFAKVKDTKRKIKLDKANSKESCKKNPGDGRKDEKSKVSSHQKQLDDLKQKDPEFYEFLKQEDQSLLNFEDGSDFDLDEFSDEESDSDVHKMPIELEEASDSDEEFHDDNGPVEDLPKKKRDSILVTQSMIEEWKTKMMQKNSSFPALKELMKSFHAAILRFSDIPEESDKKSKKQKGTKYKVLSGEIFNSIVGLCIQQVVPSLTKILDLSNKKSSSKQFNPRKSKSWEKVREAVHYYLSDVIMLNQLLLEPTVLCASLRHTILLIPYYITCAKATKQLIKYLIKTWSGSDDESVRVLSFLCINRILKMDSAKYLENTLKQCYLAYVSNCKFTTPSILPMINFLQQTLCELFALNPSVTYPIAFLYIRQLAIHLRKAMMVPKKENFQAVYNWQYVHCIGLWCRMIGNMYSVETIKPLLYPLVQVSLGTIDLVPTSRYFPLRYRIVKYLIALSECTDVYIPLLPYITKPLKLAEFSKKSGMITEPLNFATMLRLSNSQLKESSYRSATMDELYDALMEYLNTQAHSISFPEMVVPTIVSLKKYIKGCKLATYNKIIQQIISKVEENAKFITDKRSKVSFGVGNIEEVKTWERLCKNGGVPFNDHFTKYKKSRQTENRHSLADKDRNVEERLPQIDRKKFIEIAKAKDRKELTTLFEDGEIADFEEGFTKRLNDEEQPIKVKKQSSKKRKQTRKVDKNDGDSDNGFESDVVDEEPSKQSKLSLSSSRNGKVALQDEDDEPDMVEEFQFSSDED